MCQRRLVLLFSGLSSVWMTLLAASAMAQNGLADANEILRRLKTESGVEINFGTAGEVQVKVPDRNRRSSSPFSPRRDQYDGEKPIGTAAQTRVPLSAEINELLKSVAPVLRREEGVRWESDETKVRRDDLRTSLKDGFSIELDRSQGRIIINQQGVEAYAAAVRSFVQRDYPAALQHADTAAETMSGLTKVVQFRGLAHFANGNFVAAADDVYSALKAGPTYEWATVADFYTVADDYAVRYRDLQRAAKRQPDSVELQFLVAYHHMLLGHHDAAIIAWQRTDDLLPDDPVVTAQIRRLQQRPQPVATEESRSQK